MLQKTEEDVKKAWKSIVDLYLIVHRRRNPCDFRDDSAVLSEVVETLIKIGLVRESGGYYLFPRIGGYDKIVRYLTAKGYMNN